MGMERVERHVTADHDKGRITEDRTRVVFGGKCSVSFNGVDLGEARDVTITERVRDEPIDIDHVRPDAVKTGELFANAFKNFRTDSGERAFE